MSGLNEFLAKLEIDPQLQEEVQKAASPDVVVECGKRAGYAFTAQELIEAVSPNQTGDLSDDQLAGVAGGTLRDPGNTTTSASSVLTGVSKKWGNVGSFRG